MNHPKSKNVYEIAMTLHYVALAVCNEVDMMNYGSYESTCGTPCCHGGWFEFAGYRDCLSWSSYIHGASLLANHLVGVSDKWHLEVWAHVNPEIWGNKYGSFMFNSVKAFGKKDNDRLTLLDIANHWYEVGSRLEEIDKVRRKK